MPQSGVQCFQDATGAARNERLYGSMRSRTSHSQGQYRPQQQQQQQQHYQHDDRFGRQVPRCVLALALQSRAFASSDSLICT